MVYNEEHFNRFGYRCKFMHELFHWQGITDNKVSLISDSICKWTNEIPHMEIQACPGLTLSGALTKITSGKLEIQNFHGLVFHVGTNNVIKSTPEQIGQAMGEIVDYVKENTPTNMPDHTTPTRLK